MSQMLPRITAMELLRALKRDGWEQLRQSGSHVILKHADKARYVTVPKHATVTIKPKTLETIQKQAGLTTKQLRELL